MKSDYSRKVTVYNCDQLAIRNAIHPVEGVPVEEQADTLVTLWGAIMVIQERPNQVPLLDNRVPEVKFQPKPEPLEPSIAAIPARTGSN